MPEQQKRGEAGDRPDRLFASETEIPWYKSTFENLRELILAEKLPPLELTSKPVPVKDLWSAGTNPKALASSFVVQGIAVAILMLLGTNTRVRKAITNVVLMAPPPPLKPSQPKPNQGGGGGSRSPLPAVKARLPKPAPKVFIPPLVTIDHPALTLDASLIAPQDAWAAPPGAIGNPLGQIGGGGGSGGAGSGGGIGNGTGTGNGNGNGTGGGSGAGIYSPGNGVTGPTIVTEIQPEYSDDARKVRLTGSVLLSIVVSTGGKATNIEVIKSLGMGLDEKAIEAVRKWLFKPGTNKGVPVNVRAQVRVTFTLL